MDALTGSYAVSSNPSVMNEPPSKLFLPTTHLHFLPPSLSAKRTRRLTDSTIALSHLDRLRGTFGTLFMRMQPKLGKRLDRVRLGLANDSSSSLSVFSENEYTAVCPLPPFCSPVFPPPRPPSQDQRLTHPGRARRSPRLPLRNPHKRHPSLQSP